MIEIHMKYRQLSQGFALPTVVITSVVMFAILVVATGTVSSSRVALDSQYYENLAHDAAESGLAYAQTCLDQVAGTASATQWSNSTTATLASGQDCSGVAISGANCSDSTGPSQCYVVTQGNVRSRFVIQPLKIASSIFNLSAIGYTDVYRSTGDKWKTFTSTLSLTTSTDQYGLATGNDTSCSILQGQLYCWGKNTSGQVGNGATSNVSSPVLVRGALSGKTVYDVTTGINHSCAIAGSSPSVGPGAQLYCWGDNSFYQYGTNSTVGSLTPTAAASIAGYYPVSVSARDHTCVVVADNATSSIHKEYCWGDNSYGQAGESGAASATPSTLNPKPSPAAPIRLRASPYSDLTNVQQISNIHSATSCGLDGTKVFCIGLDSSGQLGDGANTSSPRVAYAIGMTNATKVVTNNNRNCAINSGTVYCWGSNQSGGTIDYRLDSGPNFATTSTQNTPTQVITSASSLYGQTVSDIAISDWNMCLVISGSVYCSGYNDRGQLGQGNTSGPAIGTATAASQVRSANNAIKVNGALTGKSVTRVVGGNNHICAITTDRIVYCWGSNGYGQLGNGTTNDSSTPTRIILPPSSVY